MLEKDQRPVISWVADLDAGPVTQSNFNVPAEATLEKSNILVSKERSVMWGVVAIPSCMRRPVKASPPVASEPQVNWPVVEFQRRVWVSEEQSDNLAPSVVGSQKAEAETN